MIHHKPHVWFLHWRPEKLSTGPPQTLFFLFLFNNPFLPSLFSCNLIITSCSNWIALKRSDILLHLTKCSLKCTIYMFEKELQRENRQSLKMKMKIDTETIRASKGRLVGKRISALLREGRGRFYILRRCIIMLLCSQD